MPCLPLMKLRGETTQDDAGNAIAEMTTGEVQRMPCIYINHGGGPLPLLGQQPDIASFLSSYAKTLPATPSAILVVTAHWETQVTTVSTATSPPLYFDYGGFPPESYEYKYPAPGSPTLARRIAELLRGAGLSVAEDSKRGWDHGVFVPLMLMFPEARVPVVSLSLLASQDAAAHIEVGEALRPLRDQGVLLVGSGASFHNFKYFFARSPAERATGERFSREWDTWLRGTVASEPPYAERKAALAGWRTAPGALESHPLGAAEHLMPLFLIFGAGGADAESRASAPNEKGFALSTFEFA